MQLLAFLLVVAVLVFVLLLAEFAIVNLTSSLTLSILGILKELVTILLAAATRGDMLNAVNLSGFAICSFGVLLYHFIKQRRAMQAMLRRLPCAKAFRAQKWWVQMLDDEAPAAVAVTPSAGAELSGMTGGTGSVAGLAPAAVGASRKQGAW